MLSPANQYFDLGSFLLVDSKLVVLYASSNRASRYVFGPGSLKNQNHVIFIVYHHWYQLI